MFENAFIYQPSPWEDRPWRQLSGLPLEEVWVSVDDHVTVFGWFVDAGPEKPVVFWCHGNAGNVSHRLLNMGELFLLGVSMMIFDYRGYGQSTGTPSEKGMYADALACYDYLHEQRHVSSDRIILFGRSLGGGVAAEVALQRQAAGLILEGAFPSIQSMADHHYFGVPARWFVNAEFPLAQKISQVTKPVLVIHGERDSVVPPDLGRQVFDSAREPKRWYLVPGADHNDVPFTGGKAYYQELLKFMRGIYPEGF